MPVAAPGPPWLVLPTYNEAENVEGFVAAARDKLPAAARILIVDDGSPDGTGAIADRLAARVDGVEVLHRPRKEGLGPAYVAGFRRALAGGAGLCWRWTPTSRTTPPTCRACSRRGSGPISCSARATWPAAGSATGAPRGARSAAAAAPTRAWCWASEVRDLTGGFKCFRREVLEAIDLDSIRSRGYAFQVEMTYRTIQRGFSVAEVPIVFRERRAGASKMGGAIVLEAAWRVPALRLSAR